MASIVHPRHGTTVAKAERILRDLPAEQKYVIIVYDGSMVPKNQRQASWVSNAPDADVKAVCGAIQEA